MNALIITHACSLGNLCQASQLLKDTKLKLESYPFDWIFSNTQNAINIINDDFNSFLDRNLYISINEKQGGHSLYNPRMFNHHNPKDNNDNYNYFKRCVDRFRKLLICNENKLFIVIFPNNKESNFDNVKKQIIELNNCLQTRTSNHYFFVIFHIPDKETSDYTISMYDNVKIVTFRTKLKSNGVRFRDETENTMLQKILLENYTFQTKKLE